MKSPLKWLVVSRPRNSQSFAVDQLPGAALMAKREVWEKVGFLNEQYQFLYEDVDWCYRAKKLGFKLMVVPGAQITHHGGASWKQKLKLGGRRFYYQFFSSMLLFVRENYSPFKHLLFRLAIVFSLFLSFKLQLALNFLKRDVKQVSLWQ